MESLEENLISMKGEERSGDGVTGIVVTYNSEETISEALSSLCNNGVHEKNLILIDNASSDNTLTVARAHFPHARIVENEFNQGFAKACNQGLKNAETDWVLFFNPDAVLREGALEKLINEASQDTEMAIIGHGLLGLDGDTQENLSRVYPGEEYFIEGKSPWESFKGGVASLIGASLLCQRSKMLELRGFDEDFFLYGEDLDLCLRTRKKGWGIGYLDEALAVHVGGHSEASFPPLDQHEKKMRALLLFYQKHLNQDQRKMAILGQLRKLSRRALPIWLGSFFREKDVHRWNVNRLQSRLLRKSLEESSAERLMNMGFVLRDLSHPEINNELVLKGRPRGMALEIESMTHRSREKMSTVLEFIDQQVARSLVEKSPLPLVRFADGEYSFYARSLACNGLYLQAESVEAIDDALPRHAKAMGTLSKKGLVAPLIFSGNLVEKKSKKKQSLLGSAGSFLDWLHGNEVKLTSENTLPFYGVYAYLTSKAFLDQCQGRKVAVLNSTFAHERARSWFSRFGHSIEISHVPLAEEFLATTAWRESREDVLKELGEVDLCIVGAGIGALEVCVDISMEKGIPCLDGGHILNLLNGRVDKSSGDRLFTVWQHDLA